MQKDLNIVLKIINKDVIYTPLVVGEIKYVSYSNGTASELEFSVIKDSKLNFTEGNHVYFTVNDKKVFYGFIFTKTRGDNGNTIKVKAYDQIRYLKNKDNLEFTPRTADKYITRIAGQTRLTCGVIENTEHEIELTVEEGTSYLEMISKALETTKKAKGKEYIFYDDFCKLTLKNVNNLDTNCRITENTLQDFSYSTSIEESYNKVKLLKDDGRKNEAAIEYVEKDEESIKNWGVLQYYEKLSTDEPNGKASAVQLLKQHNKKIIKLSLQGVFGDVNVRGGKNVFVELTTGGTKLKQFLQVTRCTHSFSKGRHFMDLEVKGGVLSGE